ncbi:hypothetical protein PsorP6_005928 [Peronosclerospora sorghi]|uniref:Uncharacterized protein n=1 Tax=Peronosclerospora sorghi TaxID=230839 RepID=A0ACC0W0T7_9STRA|nr:hypothetical protein PsorP6_005928 [Peronosclerospora sorghi]
MRWLAFLRFWTACANISRSNFRAETLRPSECLPPRYIVHQMYLFLVSSLMKMSFAYTQCNDFNGEYEDEFTRTFCDDFTPSQERMCVTTLQGKFAVY